MATNIPYPSNTSGWGKTLIDGLNSVFNKLEKQIDGINNNINSQFKTFKEEICAQVDEIKVTATNALSLAQENEKNIKDMRTEMGYINFTCDNLISENKMLKQRTNSLENYSRRNNIVIRGIAETDKETNASCEESVRNFLRDQLKLSDDIVEAMTFIRCHRLGGREKKNFQGRSQATQKRPVIVRFASHKDKSLVWNARSKITDYTCSISENFSNDTEYNRKKLYIIYKKAKNMEQYKRKISLIGDVLVIDSVRYTVETLHMLPKELEPRQFSEKTDGKYLVFGGIHSNYQPFSNWFPSKICYKGNTFMNIEQAYQWAKAMHAEDTTVAGKILFTTDPRKAKDLGLTVKGLGTRNWNTRKNIIMKELVNIKFTDNPILQKVLLDTAGIKLAEAGIDAHYAIGLPLTSVDIYSCNKWKGQNCLGDILCNLRSDLLNA